MELPSVVVGWTRRQAAVGRWPRFAGWQPIDGGLVRTDASKAERRGSSVLPLEFADDAKSGFGKSEVGGESRADPTLDGDTVGDVDVDLRHDQPRA